MAELVYSIVLDARFEGQFKIPRCAAGSRKQLSLIEYQKSAAQIH